MVWLRMRLGGNMEGLKDTEFNLQRERIRKLYEHWSVPCGLTWWKDMQLEYVNAPNADDIRTTASATSSWEYRFATLTFYMPKIAELDDEELEDVLVHEIAHLLVAPITATWRGMPEDQLRVTYRQLEESTVANMASVLRWTHKAGAGLLDGVGEHPFRKPKHKLKGKGKRKR